MELEATAKLDSLRQYIAKGLDDAVSGRAKEIDFADLKQQGRQLLQTHKSTANQ
jgi:hypothetical protein